MLTRSFVAASFLALLVAACSARVAGSGRVTSETRRISNIHAVDLAGIGELTIIQGEPTELVVEAEDNLLPLIQTKVKAGTLQISEEGTILARKPVRFRLTVPNLDQIVSTGAGNVRADKFSSPGLLDLSVEGAGGVELTRLDCATFKLDLGGAGTVKVQGRARDSDIEISGAATYLGDQLRTRDTKLAITGSGDAKVWAMGELDVNISGSGTLDYFGHPKVKKEISGAGSLHSLGEKARQ